MSAMLGKRSLDWFEAVGSTDEVKTDLELWCRRCDSHLCDVESGDTLAVLVSVAEDHICNDAYSVRS